MIVADYVQRLVQICCLYSLVRPRQAMAAFRLVGNVSWRRLAVGAAVVAPLLVLLESLTVSSLYINFPHLQWGGIAPYPFSFARYFDLYVALPIIAFMDGVVWYRYMPLRFACLAGGMGKGLFVLSCLFCIMQWGGGVNIMVCNLVFTPLVAGLVLWTHNAIPAMVVVYVMSAMTMHDWHIALYRYLESIF
ncbi:MAG: hypothetical protein AB7E47_09890 [Desulfovibrionaceae bacterium]